MTQKWFMAFWMVVSLALVPSIGVRAQTYHSPNGYSITAPSGWTLEKKPNVKSEIFIMAKPDHKFSDNLNVRSIPFPGQITLEQVQNELKTSYVKQFPGYKLISERFTTVGGQRAYEIIFRHTQGGQFVQLWARQDAVIHAGKLYFFTCTALPSNAAHYTPGFNRIISSVR